MNDAPERIYGWLNTQLSIARHYGGIKYNGKDYVIAVDEDRQPLVRVDVLKREKRAKGVNRYCAKRNIESAASQDLQLTGRDG